MRNESPFLQSLSQYLILQSVKFTDIEKPYKRAIFCFGLGFWWNDFSFSKFDESGFSFFNIIFFANCMCKGHRTKVVKKNI